MSLVVGLDLSLTGTGIATHEQTWRVATEPKDGNTIQRVALVLDLVVNVLERKRPELVVVEAPSFASVGGSGHERGYLWWRVMEEVERRGIDWKTAAPSSIKKYATGSGATSGKGKVDKDAMMLATARRFEWFAGKNDEADALWACAMGYEWLEQPIVDLPQVNREALNPWRKQAAA